MVLPVTKVEEISVQGGLRELGMLLAQASPEVRAAMTHEVIHCLEHGARHIDRLERQVAIERAINDEMRREKPKPPEPDYFIRAMFAAGGIIVFGVVWWSFM